MLKKLIVHLIINLLLIGSLVGIYIKLPEVYQSIDNRLRDFMFVSRGKQPDSKIISIVTIDEDSLKELGQWPWERNKIAQMLQNLSSAGASLIAMDVFFSEKDKSSPQNILQALQLQKGIFSNQILPDYDQIMANSISQTPTVLGYIFDLKNSRNTEKFPMINVTISEKNFSGTDFLPLAKGVTLNLEKFQDNALSSGFINNIPDASGMIRRVPLLIKYQEIVFTSLAMEVYRLLTAVDSININYLETGISLIELVSGENISVIPTDRHGRLFLNFLGPQRSFTYISAKDVIANNFNQDLVKEKIILFGATSVGLMDLRATPFDNALPGIEVHATAIENMLKKNYLYKPDWEEGATVLILFITGLLLTVLYSFLPAYWVAFLMLISLYVMYKIFDYLLFQQGMVLNLLFPLLSIFMLTIGSTITNYFLENRQRKIIRENFSKKVSAAVVDDILSKSSKDLLIAQEKEISIFFSDIRDFTSISEALASPTKLIDVLNIYMTPMVNNIMQKQGTVDKFIGDAIMAYWNAPHSVKNHADMAIQSAIQQIQQLQNVNTQLQQKYNLTIDIGIGINTGVATVGEMGTSGRSDYTIIGDAVNLASRLEGLNKTYGSRLIISEFTLQQAQQDYVIRELDKVRVKGKQEAIRIYEVIEQGLAQRELKQELEYYAIAHDLYYQGQFELAKEHFNRLLSLYPDSKLYVLFYERCQYFLDNPPDDFDGVFIYSTK